MNLTCRTRLVPARVIGQGHRPRTGTSLWMVVPWRSALIDAGPSARPEDRFNCDLPVFVAYADASGFVKAIINNRTI